MFYMVGSVIRFDFLYYSKFQSGLRWGRRRIQLGSGVDLHVSNHIQVACSGNDLTSL
jgi:hypothetical protein